MQDPLMVTPLVVLVVALHPDSHLQHVTKYGRLESDILRLCAYVLFFANEGANNHIGSTSQMIQWSLPLMLFCATLSLILAIRCKTP